MADVIAIKLKFGRAAEHINELDSKIQAIDPKELYGFRREFDSERDMFLYIGTHKEEPIQGLPPIIGDAVQNMRSVLDYIIWELSLPKIRKGDYEGTGVGFPLYDVPNNSRFLHCLRYISEDIKDDVVRIVRRFQPYEMIKRVERPKSAPVLFILNELSIQNKHHSLTVAPLNLSLPRLGDYRAEVIELSENTTITIEIPASTNPKQNFEPKLALVIGIKVPKLEVSPRQVVPYLRYTHDYIRDTVLPEFMPFLG